MLLIICLLSSHLLAHVNLSCNAKQCARSTLHLVSALEYEHFIEIYCCLLALAGYPINAHNRACALLSPSPFHNVMAKIVPAMQLAAHAKSSTLCGGPYSVKSNFFGYGLLLFCITMGLRCTRCVKEEFKSSGSPPSPPPYPTTPPHLLRTANFVSHI